MYDSKASTYIFFKSSLCKKKLPTWFNINRSALCLTLLLLYAQPFIKQAEVSYRHNIKYDQTKHSFMKQQSHAAAEYNSLQSELQQVLVFFYHCYIQNETWNCFKYCTEKLLVTQTAKRYPALYAKPTSWGRSVSIVSNYRLYDRGSISGRGKGLFL
jgi:hypothetical protein